ncbi:TetR/AcrR family transcriptional regulator [Mycolicibacterium sp. P9-22]|nr:TetR/AcrR family transcriptional regulator [Mycolicibacterium sp. P9-22]
MARLPGSKNHVAPETEEPNDQETQRERIYRAAVASFDARGINRASMEKVAQQAGVSRQTVYFYFPDKVSLIAEVVLRHAREWLAEISEQLKGRPNGVQPIVEAMVLCVDGALRDTYLALLLRPTSDKLATALATMPAVREAQEALWYPLFRRARESGELRADLSDDDLMAWITLVGLAIMTHGSERGLDDLTKVESLLNQFMVPSLHRQAENVVSLDPADD